MIIGISGLQGAGKDTLANILVSDYGYYKYNLAEPLYKLAVTLYPKSCLNAYYDNLGIWDSTKLENQKRLFKETCTAWENFFSYLTRVECVNIKTVGISITKDVKLCAAILTA